MACLGACHAHLADSSSTWGKGLGFEVSLWRLPTLVVSVEANQVLSNILPACQVHGLIVKRVIVLEMAISLQPCITQV